jgi:hypothetical protein
MIPVVSSNVALVSDANCTTASGFKSANAVSKEKEMPIDGLVDAVLGENVAGEGASVANDVDGVSVLLIISPLSSVALRPLPL